MGLLKDILRNVIGFFGEPIWETIGNCFTAVGVISTFVAIIRFFHNRKIPNWQDNVSIKDYPSNYDVDSREKNPVYSILWDDTPNSIAPIIVFKPIGTVISTLKVIKLGIGEKPVETIEKFKHTTPNDSICFRIERAENMSLYKIRWYSEFGEYSEYYFNENRRNGKNAISGACYKATFFSTIRRIFGFR